MRSDEVVVHIVERNRVAVILYLLGVPVGFSGEAPYRHPHREVLTLDVGRADLLLVRVPHDDLLVGARIAAAPVALAVAAAVLVSVLLHEHRVVDVGAKRLFYGDHVRLVTVTRELDAVRHAGPQVCDERLAGLGCPVTEPPRRHQLGIRVNRDPHPHVSRDKRRSLGALKTAGLRVDERPYLVDLDVPTVQVPQDAVLKD